MFLALSRFLSKDKLIHMIFYFILFFTFVLQQLREGFWVELEFNGFPVYVYFSKCSASLKRGRFDNVVSCYSLVTICCCMGTYPKTENKYKNLNSLVKLCFNKSIDYFFNF